MARATFIGGMAAVVFALSSAPSAAPSSIAASANPTSVTAGVATPVVITSQITDTTLLGANLLRTDATGKTLSIVGAMRDDGLNGDAVAGDKIFSYRVTINQATAGKLYYRVSAAFRGTLLRVLSNNVAVSIVTGQTTPQITLTLTPDPGANGWSRVPVVAHYTCTPQGATIVSCPADQTFSIDGRTFVASGTATDQNGGTASVSSAPFNVDQTAPSIAASLTPNLAPGAWTNGSVQVQFTCADALSGVASCTPAQTVSNEGGGQTVSGTVTDIAGNSVSLTAGPINIDTTNPSISVALTPNVPAGSWTSSPVLASFTCSDSLSGVTNCPADQLVATNAANLSVSASITDAAGNAASVTSSSFNIDAQAPSITATMSPAPNSAGWNNGPVTIHFDCADPLSGLASCEPDRVVSADGAGQQIVGTAVDLAGNVATRAVAVNVDSAPPAIAFGAAPNGGTVFTPTVTLSGTVSDVTSPIVSVTCGSIAATVLGGQFDCPATLALGSNTIDAIATDAAGNQRTTSISVSYVRPPVVTLTSPTNLDYLNISPTTVTGFVDDPAAVISINTIAVPSSNGSFSFPLPIAEGPNVITVTATAPGGATGTASITVTLDTTAPRVTITSPGDNSITTDDVLDIAGSVNDLVVGTVNDTEAQVTVNGAPALVANRTFVLNGLALVPGPNVIQATARDRVGNFTTTQITVIRQVVAAAQIKRVSGNSQSAPIGATVTAPLVISLLDAAGNAVANKSVIFKVVQNDGQLDSGGPPADTIIVTTDTQGRAQANWRLGRRSGAGGNVVEAYAVGYDGTAVFTATGVPAAAGKIVVDTGNDQIGGINEVLPKPFIAVVIDNGNNRLGGVPVTFTVKQGGGTIEGQPSKTVVTDSDGRAAAVLTLGAQEGNANNLVEATFPTNTEFPAAFTASGRVPGNPAQTTIAGVVLDNSNVPIAGVTVRAVLTSAMRSSLQSVQNAPAVTTDAQGQFAIPQAPVGIVKLLVDGTTVTSAGPYPSLEYDLITVAGQENTIGQPIYLVALTTQNSLCVTDTTGGGTLTVPEAPGFSLTFGPGQVTFPGGSKTGCVSVTVVNGDKVPMVPGFGQQPRFIVTIQPSGALFSPPAPITIPNVDGLAPREVTEMYSYDHDIGSFVAIGTGVVSDDGQVIRSSTGVGVLKAGWHCGGNPNTTGTAATCPTCQRCQGTNCVADDGQTPPQTPNDCRKELCNGGGITTQNDDNDHASDACCFAGGSLPKFGNDVATLNSSCPAKAQVVTDGPGAEFQHRVDGCSVPGILALLTPGLSVQDPTGGYFNVSGTSTTFGQDQGGESNPINQTSDALNLPCNQHDICYQTCGSSQAACDTGMYNGMVAVCNAAYPTASCPYSGAEAVAKCYVGNPLTGNTYFTERNDCFNWASTYKFGLDNFGASAWEERQSQFCKCCN